MDTSYMAIKGTRLNTMLLMNDACHTHVPWWDDMTVREASRYACVFQQLASTASFLCFRGIAVKFDISCTLGPAVTSCALSRPAQVAVFF
jgi:hypothetical protein